MGETIYLRGNIVSLGELPREVEGFPNTPIRTSYEIITHYYQLGGVKEIHDSNFLKTK